MSDQIQPTLCPECHKQKPVNPADVHDVVLPRKDWRKADRTTIHDHIPDSPMCLQCFVLIQDAFAPLAPAFDKKGKKL